MSKTAEKSDWLAKHASVLAANIAENLVISHCKYDDDFPEFALVVYTGGEPAAEYWPWLIAQFDAGRAKY